MDITDKKILIVEDEVGLAELLRDYLQAAGYQIVMLHEGTRAVEQVKQLSPNLVILDLMLPGKDGIDICREVRAFSEVPVIMTTARVEEIDRLLGLEMGADDYICKPYSPREVVARVKTVLRRVAPDQSTKYPHVEGLLLDEDRYQASFNGTPLDLTPVEFRLLKIFSSYQGRVFSRSYLIDNLYTDGRIVSERTVDTHIKNLRKKLQPMLSGEVIHSVYGVGYRMELDV